MPLRRFPTLLAAVCALAIGCATTDPYHKRQQQQETEQHEVAELPTGTIQGTLRDSASGRPIAWANVIVLGTRRGAQADEKGRFRIPLVPAGNRRVVVQPFPDSFRRLEVDVTIVERAVSNLDLKLVSALPQWSFLNAIGADVPKAKHLLRMKLQPTRKRFRIGERPTFTARIYYFGSDSIYLESAPYGWSTGREFPYVDLSFREPASMSAISDRKLHWPVRGQLDASDFYVVHKGEYIFAAQGAREDSVIQASSSLRVPGRHEVVMTYSTRESDVAKWVQIAPGVKRPSDQVLVMLRRVPLVELRDAVVIWVDP